MSNRSFYLEDTNEYIRYAVGQPMGLKSSFAMLALAHHVIVQIAAIQAYGGARLYKEYAILGDDIVLAEDAVADNYRMYMTRLGLTIQDTKSL